MKKFCIFLALILAFGCWSISSAEEGITEISSKEELEQMRMNPEGKYVLTADIDFQGENWMPVRLSGSFDGNGHMISNIVYVPDSALMEVTLDGNKKAYDTVCVGFFGALEGASVSSLILENVTADIMFEGNVFLGGLAGWMEETSIENCSVSGDFQLISGGQMTGVSGLIGYGDGSITDSSADVKLWIGDTEQEIPTEQFLGGALACGYANISGCTVKLDALSAVWGYCHDGGIVGMFDVQKKDMSKHYRIADSSIEGTIHFFEKGPSRRAYCKPFIGEKLNGKISVSHNKKDFTKEELKEYPEEELKEFPVIQTGDTAETVPSDTEAKAS